ncbi:3-5 EXONUCLEASE [Salix koriyanagi]|uniref:3-5 EXONUCLEASE n=1 Tax=Salix koriyanagi TaxID=2511006 RepID=A0A9Q1APW8_9ROSI|nr:3-5 EXONUCLEASE [Salix koriyanagi]
MVFLGVNHTEHYLSYELQCDNMHCYTTVTRNATYLTSWVAELLSAFAPQRGRRLRVSMDMIWDQFVNDANLYPPVTLQFCYDHTCIVYQVSPPENFPRSSLEHFLNHDHVDFFGFEMLYKVQYLRQAYNLVVKNWFDIPCQACLANPTRYRNVASLSVQNMVSMDFSKLYTKPLNLLRSDWRSNVLTDDKVMYATLDCFFAYKFAVRVSNFPRPN